MTFRASGARTRKTRGWNPPEWEFCQGMMTEEGRTRELKIF